MTGSGNWNAGTRARGSSIPSRSPGSFAAILPLVISLNGPGKSNYSGGPIWTAIGYAFWEPFVEKPRRRPIPANWTNCRSGYAVWRSGKRSLRKEPPKARNGCNRHWPFTSSAMNGSRRTWMANCSMRPWRNCERMPLILPRFRPALVTVAPNVCDTNGGHSEKIWLHADCVLSSARILHYSHSISARR